MKELILKISTFLILFFFDYGLFADVTTEKAQHEIYSNEMIEIKIPKSDSEITAVVWNELFSKTFKLNSHLNNSVFKIEGIYTKNAGLLFCSLYREGKVLKKIIINVLPKKEYSLFAHTSKQNPPIGSGPVYLYMFAYDQNQNFIEKIDGRIDSVVFGANPEEKLVHQKINEYISETTLPIQNKVGEYYIKNKDQVDRDALLDSYKQYAGEPHSIELDYKFLPSNRSENTRLRVHVSSIKDTNGNTVANGTRAVLVYRGKDGYQQNSYTYTNKGSFMANIEVQKNLTKGTLNVLIGDFSKKIEVDNGE